MKLIITEHQYKKLLNEMPYPQSFNMEVFKSINSFAGRVKYCREHLKRIAEGSSRMVFKIDDEKVLKLAKNRKGLSQNKAEADMGYNEGYFTCVAEVFDYDDNYLFVEMEYARPCSKNDFLRIEGHDFETFQKFIISLHNDRVHIDFDQETIDDFYDNQSLATQIFEFSNVYDIPISQISDILLLKHYGIVKRNGVEYIVIIDYGLTNEIYNKHYNKSQKKYY